MHNAEYKAVIIKRFVPC